MSEPRTWTLCPYFDPNRKTSLTRVSGPRLYHQNGDVVVIEKSVFDALKAENEFLKEQLAAVRALNDAKEFLSKVGKEK